MEEVGGGWRRGQPGRRPAHGSHRLTPSMWQLPIGPRRQFLEDWQQLTPVTPSYKYERGGGENMDTHTTQVKLNTLLALAL